MRYRSSVAVLALLTALLILNGCPRGGGPAPGGAAQAVDVTLADFTFRMSTNTVNRGQTSFRLKNDGPSVHNFTIIGVKGASSQDLSAGVTQNLEVILDRPGRYSVHCTVPGHKESGMVADLIVK